MNNFDNKTVVITGGASGIGETTARRFAKLGASVAIFDKDRERSASLVDELSGEGASVMAETGDVSNPEDCARAVQRAVAETGGVDVLVNVAGGGQLCPTEELEPESWRNTQAINCDGTFYMARHTIPHMLAAGGGAIVNVSSIYGAVGLANHAAYTATKGAILSLTKALGVEYASRNIRVNAVVPGVIMTPLIARQLDDETLDYLKSLHPMGRIGSTEEVADAICFLGSEQASFITGTSLMIDGGYTAQ